MDIRHLSARRGLVGLLLLIAIAAAGGFASSSARAMPFISNGDGGWFRQKPAYDASLFGVAFPNATHGWAVGDQGTILATTNGGATWKRQISGTSEILSAVTFVDAKHGWAVGENGLYGGDPSIILATTNGGATWKRQISGTDEVLSAVTFVDAKHGWAVGGGGFASQDPSIILATANGGATWKPQEPSAAVGNGMLYSVAFADAAHGWAVGYHEVSSVSMAEPFPLPVILATIDGGATWKAQDASGASGMELDSVTFVDATHGWAVGWAVGWGGTILSTADGGATWHAQVSGSNDEFRGIAFPNATHGWAVGIRGGDYGAVIRATTTGGFPPSGSTPTVTLKLSGLTRGSLKLGKSLIAKGFVEPPSLTGSGVKLTMQRKSGGSWLGVANRMRTLSASGAYSWKYKPARRGAYRMRATIAKTAAHTAATTKWRSFKVK